MSAAMTINLQPGRRMFDLALIDAARIIRDVKARLGPAPSGVLRGIACVADEAARTGQAFEVSTVNALGQLTPTLARPTGRTVWLVGGDWPSAARGVEAALIEAAAREQHRKENGPTEARRAAGEVLWKEVSRQN